MDALVLALKLYDIIIISGVLLIDILADYVGNSMHPLKKGAILEKSSLYLKFSALNLPAFYPRF